MVKADSCAEEAVRRFCVETTDPFKVFTADGAGTGLGLAITQDIVKLHNGRIYFESKQGVGTTFRFVLPIKPKQKEEKAESG